MCNVLAPAHLPRPRRKYDNFSAKTVVKSASSETCPGWQVWGKMRGLVCHDSKLEGCMESRAPEGVSAVSASNAAKSHPHEGRNFWVLTAYGISGLALFGVLAYYFSDFVSH